jgi:TonB family protein
MAVPNSKRLVKGEEENDKKGTMLSIALHVLMLLALLFVPVSKPILNENTQIQVTLPPDMLGGGPALGLPNQGQGDTPSPGKPDPDAGPGKSEPKPTPVPPAPDPKPAPPPKPVISKPVTAPAPPKKVETTEDPNAVALRRAQQETQRKAEEEKYRQAQVKRQAEEAQRAEENRKAEEARQAQAAKDKFKNRFPGGGGTGTQSGTSGGGGTGGGLGNSGRSGSGGQPDGDPDSRRLDGIGRGPGVANGFGNRGVRSAPKLQETSQKAGRVVLNVCIDNDGNVISASYKAVGSTTSDSELQDAAIRNARQYRFEPGSSDKTCGTITYNFIVK